MRSFRTGVALAAALCAVGCGESSPPPPETGSSGDFPVTAAGVTVQSRPERIVSLSPSATETLFAVGAGDQIVAVDSASNHPAGVPTTELSAYEPNVEAIAGFRPDLVVLPADVPRDAIAGLKRLRLTVVATPAPADLGDAYDQMRDLGALTGRRDAGEDLARRVGARVDAAIAEAPRGGRLRVFHEVDPDLFSASSDTFIGRIYARLGLRNVADRAADRSGTPYPQLSAEAVVSADPDLIVLTDAECCGQTPARVRRRPGWGEVSAVREDAVVAVDADVASRWGPRIPEFVEDVAAAMERAG
jgi:iron complex transport system substrate-binding protein